MNKNYETLELHKILEMLADHCSNEKTREMALSIVPSDDLYTVQREINKTVCAFDLSVKYGTPVFYGMKDISAALKRADAGAVLSLKELLDIKRVLAQINILSGWYKNIEDNENELDHLFECLFPNKYLEERLDKAIIDENELADDASTELLSIRRKIANSGIRIRETLDKMIKSSSVNKYLQDSIVTIRDGRFVLPVKSEHKGQVNGLVHDTSATGSTLFIEPMSVVEANNDIRILKGKEQDEIHRILSEFSAECAQIKDQLISGYNAAAELNLYFAKANLAAAMKACAPELNDKNIIVLNKARHPLINADDVVPINFSIGEEYGTLIITGPNTGGKTVVLKTVGLLTLMTMCGLLIPVSDGSKISIYKNILVDIGDQQSIEQSLSTFSSHMNRVVEILEKADEKSLVLLDELGSGTDPVEGAALAVAIIEDLKSNRSTTITTTHYQELKMYALNTPEVENASCEFNVETLKPTYRLIIGTPGKSNAFAISERLGMPKEIIDYAQSLITSENRKFETIIDNLERTRIRLEENNRAVEQYKKECEKLKGQLQEERERLYNEKEEELEKARKVSAEIVSSVQRQSQRLLDELEKIKKDKNKSDFSDMVRSARQLHKTAINKLYLEANPVSENKNEHYVLPRPLKKGDSVLITDTNRKGILVSPPDNKGICFVQVGVMKTKIDISKLRLIEKSNTSKEGNKKKNKSNSYVSSTGVESRMTRKVQSELDIRGYAVDDGLYEVDDFLDNAVMSGISIVTIIHGKGTGVLKNAVRNHLKRHPHVKSSRKGVYGEGEDGVTVVELK